jgi:FixJ family two-component response regulator
MNEPAPTVYIVDDDASFLTSIARLLRVSGFPVRTFASPTEFLAQLHQDAPGCVIADLQMPGMSGIQLQEALMQASQFLPVVFLSGRADVPTSVTAMRKGAEDFLTKRAPQADLLAAVTRALQRNELERQQRARRIELQARFDSLTPRDRDVLVHVLRGRLNKQIAADLCVDERSVKRHRTSVMSKLQVTSVAELSRLAYEAASGGASWLQTPQQPSSTSSFPDT